MWVLFCPAHFWLQPATTSAFVHKAKAMVLEHNLVQFAATALGQIYSSIEGFKVVFTAKSLPVPVLYLRVGCLAMSGTRD